jgi:hypothetical protein
LLHELNTQPATDKTCLLPGRPHVGSSQIRAADEELHHLQKLLDHPYTGWLAPSAHKHEEARDILETGRRGAYAKGRLEKMSQDRIKRFFLKGTGSNAGMVRVREGLRTMVVFRQANLLDASWPIREPIDAIFCRNFMIYFDR